MSSCDFERIYYKLLKDLIGPDSGVRRTRGTVSREKRGPTFIHMDWPYSPLVMGRWRSVNHRFAVAEWLWMTLGLDRVHPLAAFNKNISSFSDDGDTLAGAYGPMLQAGLADAVTKLVTDQDSRQAVVQIFRPGLIARGVRTKDVPCTLSMHFLAAAPLEGAKVEGRRPLDMVATMRSNDAWLGLPYDVFSFSMIHRQVAQALAMDVGSYCHVAHSEHLYEEHWAKVKSLTPDDLFDTPIGDQLPVPSMPLLKQPEELERLQDVFLEVCQPGPAPDLLADIPETCAAFGWKEAAPYLMLLRSKWDQVETTGNFAVDQMMLDMNGRKP